MSVLISVPVGMAISQYSILNNVCDIGVQERHLLFKGIMQLNYNVLVFTHYAMSFCIMTRTYSFI